MKGVILAAGLGTRLWPLTLDRAKPAVPFLNRPLIEYCIDYLYSFGIREVIINLHHQVDSIRRVLKEKTPRDLHIMTSYEEEILGTGGALDRVRHLLSDETFVVMNGKILTEIDLQAAFQTHRENSAIATLVLRHNRTLERFSIVETKGHDRVTHFAGFPPPWGEGVQPSANNPPLMFTGVQILEPTILEFIPKGKFSHTTTSAYPQAIRAGRCLAAHVSDAPWFELSTLDRYLRASLTFLEKTGRSFIMGKNCRIHPTARVERSVLWDDIHIGPDTHIKDCILGDHARIPDGSAFTRVAIVPASPKMDDPRGRVVDGNLVVEIT